MFQSGEAINEKVLARKYRGSRTPVEADTEFHIGIAQLTRNRLVVRAVTEVRCHMERIMFAAIDIGYYGEVPAREHTKILEAICERDALLARKLMYDHIVGSKDKVLQLASGRSSPNL